MKKEPVMEIFLVSIGALLGSLIPALTEFGKFLADPSKVTGVGLLTILLAGMMLAVSGVTGVLWHRRFGTKTSMVNAICGRPRVPVMMVHDHAA